MNLVKLSYLTKTKFSPKIYVLAKTYFSTKFSSQYHLFLQISQISLNNLNFALNSSTSIMISDPDVLARMEGKISR